jgi:hypothetical protein
VAVHKQQVRDCSDAEVRVRVRNNTVTGGSYGGGREPGTSAAYVETY